MLILFDVCQEAEDPRWSRHPGDLQVLHRLPADAHLRAQHGLKGEEERVLFQRVENRSCHTNIK